MSLPEKFKMRIIRLLGKDEADKLFGAIEKGGAIRAFRVNGIKTDVASFEASDASIERSPLDFPCGAYVTHEEFPGSLCEHHSGAIYMQDASAMSTVAALDIKKGWRVLDSCSAPGGKTAQIAEAVGEDGTVIANEYERKRCRILQGNIERMGAKNTVICNLDTSELSALYFGELDMVLCDAPCSGEGMFRKNPRAIEEWSEENVIMCAQRQREILSNVAKCVKAGGYLLYSTCTFATEENEENVAWFLGAHNDFELVRVKEELIENSSDGINIDGLDIDMTLCRRIYPHNSMGEGQFIALFRRVFAGEPIKKADRRQRDRREEGKRSSHQEQETVVLAREFLAENIKRECIGNLQAIGEYVYLVPDIRLPDHGVVAAGVCVGEAVKGRFLPHHQLFSAYGKDFALKLELSSRDERAERYLRGEEIECAELGDAKGYCAVLIDSVAVGGAKVSLKVAKNHYPKGLRKQK